MGDLLVFTIFVKPNRAVFLTTTYARLYVSQEFFIKGNILF
jgi:hypothetical protein